MAFYSALPSKCASTSLSLGDTHTVSLTALSSLRKVKFLSPFFISRFIETQHRTLFLFGVQGFDSRAYLETISTVSLVTIRHLPVMHFFFLVIRTLRATVLAPSKCTIQAYFRDITGSVPEHHHKFNITIILGFPKIVNFLVSQCM